MRKYKVAHISTVAKSLEVLLFNQMLSLCAEGFEVCGISSPGPEAAAIEASGIRHIPVAIPRNIQLSADLKALWQLFRVMRRERFTIVHTHFSKPGLLGQLAARLAEVPVVVNTVHGYAFHERMGAAQKSFYISLEKIAARCSDLIFIQNKDDLAAALAMGSARRDKVRYLGNGIDLRRFDRSRLDPEAVEAKRQELGFRQTTQVIGFVGRLAGQRKGFSDYLAAAKMIQRSLPEARFLIVGETDEGRPDAVTCAIAGEYGLQESCRFMGWIPNERVPLMLALMNVLVLPSLLEGMPRSLMEASAMGVPIVATEVKGNREVVQNGRNGTLVPVGDVPALAAAILELLQDPGRARAFGQQGQAIAAGRFDENQIFERVKCEYFRLLREKGLPG